MPPHASKISIEAIRRPKIREIWPLSQPADNEKVDDFRNFPHFPGLTKVPLLVTLVGHFGLVRRPLCYSSSATLHSKMAVRHAQNSRRATPKSPSELFKVAFLSLSDPKIPSKRVLFCLESITAEGRFSVSLLYTSLSSFHSQVIILRAKTLPFEKKCLTLCPNRTIALQ